MTPLLALVGLLLGVVAVMITPREEEPQIDVTMANVIVPFAGRQRPRCGTAGQLAARAALSEIEGVKHVYSVSRPGARACSRWNSRSACRARRRWCASTTRSGAISTCCGPAAASASPWSSPRASTMCPSWRSRCGPTMRARTCGSGAGGAHARSGTQARSRHARRVLHRRARASRRGRRSIRRALRAYGLTVADLTGVAAAANVVQQAGERVGADGATPVTAGTFLAGAADVANLVIGVTRGRPLLLSDVARITDGADLPQTYVWHGTPAGSAVPLPASHPRSRWPSPRSPAAMPRISRRPLPRGCRSCAAN